MQLRDEESATVLLMFLYSFLAMAGYNMIKPVTRGLFIESLGAENLPWVQFAAGIVIGLIMQAYTRVIAAVPRRWMIPVTLAGIVVLMAAFYLAFERKKLGVAELERYVEAGRRDADPVVAFQDWVGQPLGVFEKAFHEYLYYLRRDGSSGK